nr:ribonuclease H-like domain-containing protein [Tanacetum cinerariifolium]
AAGPSNNTVSLNFELGGKSSYVDPSQYHDDPDMPALEDITYYDDEEDVGVGADFSNFETHITVSPILTTRVHKYHLVTQIIGDVSSTPQTRSMTRMVKEQGGLTQINNDDFHTCMFACFLSQEEPKRGNPQHALKDKGVIDSGCSRHMTGNISYLSDFEELNGGYVAFVRNPKGGKIIGIKREFIVARTPQHNGIAERKNRTLIEAARTMLADSLLPFHFGLRGGKCSTICAFPLWSFGSKDPHNTDDDTTFEVKEPESEVHVSLSSSAKTKKHDDKTKREAKGKSLVELSTGVRMLSEEFKDFFDNNINEV